MPTHQRAGARSHPDPQPAHAVLACPVVGSALTR
jgi:hypothetical protein